MGLWGGLLYCTYEYILFCLPRSPLQSNNQLALIGTKERFLRSGIFMQSSRSLSGTVEAVQPDSSSMNACLQGFAASQLTLTERALEASTARGIVHGSALAPSVAVVPNDAADAFHAARSPADAHRDAEYSHHPRELRVTEMQDLPANQTESFERHAQAHTRVYYSDRRAQEQAKAYHSERDAQAHEGHYLDQGGRAQAWLSSLTPPCTGLQFAACSLIHGEILSNIQHIRTRAVPALRLASPHLSVALSLSLTHKRERACAVARLEVLARSLPLSHSRAHARLEVLARSFPSPTLGSRRKPS